jgi:hypothetical protein
MRDYATRPHILLSLADSLELLFLILHIHLQRPRCEPRTASLCRVRQSFQPLLQIPWHPYRHRRRSHDVQSAPYPSVSS